MKNQILVLVMVSLGCQAMEESCSVPRKRGLRVLSDAKKKQKTQKVLAQSAMFDVAKQKALPFLEYFSQKAYILKKPEHGTFEPFVVGVKKYVPHQGYSGTDEYRYLDREDHSKWVDSSKGLIAEHHTELVLTIVTLSVDENGGVREVKRVKRNQGAIDPAPQIEKARPVVIDQAPIEATMPDLD